MSCRKWQRECLQYARQAGIKDARLDSRSKHILIRGTVNGVPTIHMISRSPNRGLRGVRNMRAEINRALRAHRQET